MYNTQVRVVIDHIAGSRAGQRQEFPAGTPARVRFGRHPECEVSFDPHRDIDASSRHAELRSLDAEGVGEPRFILVDLGSSNGTYVEGHRVTEAQVAPSAPVIVEFGSGGPRVRLFVGNDREIEALPPAPVEVRKPPWLAIGIAAAVLLAIVVALAQC